MTGRLAGMHSPSLTCVTRRVVPRKNHRAVSSTNLEPPPRMQDRPGASVGAVAGDARHRHSFPRARALGGESAAELDLRDRRGETFQERQPEWGGPGGVGGDPGPEKMDRQWPPAPPSLESICREKNSVRVQKSPLERLSHRYTRRSRKMDSCMHLPFYFLKRCLPNID